MNNLICLSIERKINVNMSADEKIETNRSETLLEETFYVLTKRKSVFRVKLTTVGLSLIKENVIHVKEQTIPVKDIIGCRCLRSKKQRNFCVCQSLPNGVSSLKVVDDKSEEHDNSDTSAYLYIYAYILQNARNNLSKRERTIITLRFRSFDKYEDNYKEAQRWRIAIKKLINEEQIPSIDIDVSALNRLKADRKLLILLNPKSGSGRGRILFQNKVVPILQEAEVLYDLHITKHANYARDFIRTCNLFQWNGVVVVGGDGILFEVINGIFERWDWLQALKQVAIGIIPSGSGNGLARSIAYSCNEPYICSPTLPAALAAVRNHHELLDLVRVETTSQIIFSFLSVGWGLLSDIDIESERLRVLGGQRFALWSIARLIGLRNYAGKLWYLPASEAVTTSILNFNESNIENHQLPPEVHLETQTGRQRLDSWYSAASRRSAYFSTTGSSYESTTGSTGGGTINNSNKPRMYGPASQLPCLTASVPSNWVCIEDRFVMVHASYPSHLGEDCLFAPNAKLNDGIIWLLIVRASATRSQILHLLLGLATGAHAMCQEPGGAIELVAVNAFRIEPDLQEHGFITVDGEHVEYGPIQGEIFPALAKVMVP